MKEARTVVMGLRSMHELAPDTLRARVLQALQTADSYAEMATPLWPLLVAWGPNGVSAVERADERDRFEIDYLARTGRPVAKVAKVPKSIARAVERRMRGERIEGPRVDLSALNEFQRRVLAKTMEIPHGEVRPYSWVADEIGHPRAQRAVGTALAHNPIPFIIPCHRVVRSDGHIGQYGAGGPQAKRAVLAWEGLDPEGLERLADRGVRYVGSDTNDVFCFPTCHNARRIADAHRVAFRNVEDARSMGYRSCRACRPAPESRVAVA